jgi:predicted  nucleic acid-binding Zn-ribbon protein
MPKTADRELRDRLEEAQAEVKRLKTALAAREKPDPAVTRLRALEAELQAARLRVKDLEGENAQLQDDRGTQWVKLQAELKQARDEATQARDEALRLQKALDRASSTAARTAGRPQRKTPRRQAEPDSLLARLRGFFETASREELEEVQRELERAQRENARLNQQLSRVQLHRPGRR